MEQSTLNNLYRDIGMNQDDEAELIAVIMAALSASLSQPAGSLVINKIRRLTGQSIAWNQAGLNESIASRRI